MACPFSCFISVVYWWWQLINLVRTCLWSVCAWFVVIYVAALSLLCFDIGKNGEMLRFEDF